MTEDPVAEGVALLERHQWKRALARFQTAVEQEPRRPEAWYRLAASLDMQGRHAEAIPAYREAIRLGLEGEHLANAWAWLGSSLRRSGRVEEALPCFRLAEELGYDPECVAAWTALALLSLGRLEQALAACEQALELNADAPAYWRCKARVLRGLGRQGEGAQCYKEARRLYAASGDIPPPSRQTQTLEPSAHP